MGPIEILPGEPLEPTTPVEMPPPRRYSRPAEAGPVEAAARFATIDAVRGFALCGILVMNIMSFGWPQGAESRPSIFYYEPAELAAQEAGGAEAVLRSGPAFDRLDMAQWWLARVLVSDKMRGLFTMLFGAGLVLFATRAEAKGHQPFGLFLRRIIVLAVIGALHGYLLWSGDILFLYATVGLFSYPFRWMRPGHLVALGVALLAFSLATIVAVGAGFGWMEVEASRGRMIEATGGRPTPVQEALIGMFDDDEMKMLFDEDPEASARENAETIETYRSSDYLAQFVERAPEVLGMQVAWLMGIGFVFLSGWLALVGMGLMKAGFFQGHWGAGAYWRTALIGYGVGLPMTLLGTYFYFRFFDDTPGFTMTAVPLQYAAVLPLAMAHAAALILVVKSGKVRWLTDRLAAVGRMALTNYLMQTVLMTTFFYGYGLGWFGRLSRVELMGVVAGVWALQLLWSPVWFRWFQYGPAEWVWRAFTYMKAPAMRKVSPEPAS